ncbi:MAG: hypothetical protein AABX28_02035 [Nanoarchaeota archaeon]
MNMEKMIEAKPLLENKIAADSGEFETCVSCLDVTPIPVGTPIDVRTNYVEGGGQLCASCYLKTYYPTKNEYGEEIY